MSILSLVIYKSPFMGTPQGVEDPFYGYATPLAYAHFSSHWTYAYSQKTVMVPENKYFPPLALKTLKQVSIRSARLSVDMHHDSIDMSDYCSTRLFRWSEVCLMHLSNLPVLHYTIFSFDDEDVLDFERRLVRSRFLSPVRSLSVFTLYLAAPTDYHYTVCNHSGVVALACAIRYPAGAPRQWSSMRPAQLCECRRTLAGNVARHEHIVRVAQAANFVLRLLPSEHVVSGGPSPP